MELAFPDTKIKLFLDSSVAVLQDLRRNHGRDTVLKLDEAASSNNFNRPYTYIAIKSISSQDELPHDLKNDGDPWCDFFDTLRSLRRDKGKTVGHIFMGFKEKLTSPFRLQSESLF